MTGVPYVEIQGAPSLPGSPIIQQLYRRRSIPLPDLPGSAKTWLLGDDNTAMIDAAQTNALQRTVYISVTAGGSGYTGAPTVGLSGYGGTGMAATAVVTAGVVTGVIVTNPGVDATSAPTVTFTPTNGGTGATATAHIADLPAFSEGYLTFDSGATLVGIDGYQTPYADIVEQTVGCIFQPSSASGVMVIMGTANGNNGQGGDLLYSTSGVLTVRTGAVTTNITPPAEVVAGSWAFVAMSHSAAGVRRVMWVVDGAITANQNTGVTKTAATPSRRFAFGNSCFSVSNATGAKMAAGFYAGSLLNDSQVIEIYNRLKGDVVSRGLSVL